MAAPAPSRSAQAKADGKSIFRLLVHGDGAFAGQGIFAETLNFADIPGYTVGGTIHVIVNNLIGFTTAAKELHSSRFAAQLARRQAIPIFHVNAEDVDAVVRIARIALEYRYAFGSDVVIDLIGYRRHGHSEVDDPTVTQPLRYKLIKEHPPLWEIYAEDIGAKDVAGPGRQDQGRIGSGADQRKIAEEKADDARTSEILGQLQRWPLQAAI